MRARKPRAARLRRPIAATCVVGGALALGVLAPTSASAFSDPLTFGKPTMPKTMDDPPGGGGGRYFTGSPADGYTCKVCHRGGAAPPLRILGLPLSGYVPGTSYEVTVDWPDSLQHISLELEITDEAGIGAGTVRTPPDKELQPSELCMGTTIGAGTVLPILNRTIMQMPDCGAQQLRFLWTAPAQDRGPVRLAGSIVSTDNMQNIDGDGVADIMRVIGSPRTPSDTASQITGCSVQPSAAKHGGLGFGLLLGALALFLRRRRH